MGVAVASNNTVDGLPLAVELIINERVWVSRLDIRDVWDRAYVGG